MSMKKSSDTIGNRTLDLPTCSAVPQPTALPRAPMQYKPTINTNNLKVLRFSWRCNRQLQSSGMLYWIPEDLNPLLRDWLSAQLDNSFWRSQQPQRYWKHSNLTIHNNRPYFESDESHIQIHFNIILPSMSSSSKWYFPFRLSDLNFSSHSHLYTNDKQQIIWVHNAGATLKIWRPISWLQNPHQQLLWNLKVYYYIHNSLLSWATQSQSTPVKLIS